MTHHTLTKQNSQFGFTGHGHLTKKLRMKDKACGRKSCRVKRNWL